MRHIRQVSKGTPVKAALWQDVLCTISGAIVSLLTVKGGSLPFLTYIDGKCEPSTDLEI